MVQAKVGDTIRIIDMDGEPKYAGRLGVVKFIDDIGQLHGSWGGLAVNPDVDDFEIIRQESRRPRHRFRRMTEDFSSRFEGPGIYKLYYTTETYDKFKDDTETNYGLYDTIEIHSEQEFDRAISLGEYNHDAKFEKSQKISDIVDDDELQAWAERNRFEDDGADF